MTRFDRVEPRLTELLTDLAAPGLPDYTDDVLARTAGLRQRPRWTLLERWLPMGVLAQRSVDIPHVPWRVVLVATLLLLIVIVATLATGSTQRRPAPPFGLASNGLIMYAANGDLHTWDPESGTSRPLLAGETDDFTGGYSRDGTKLAFLRREQPATATEPELISIQVANADGSDAIDLTGPLVAPDWWDWSPSGDAIAFESVIDDQPTLQIVSTDGSAAPRVLETEMPVAFPSWLPPDGEEIVFSSVAEGGRPGLFAISPDGGEPRLLTTIDGGVDKGDIAVLPSPDGKYLLYKFWDEDAQTNRLRLLDLGTGTDEAVGPTGSTYGEGAGVFSPDGTRIAFLGYGVGDFRLFVVPTDGSAEPREVRGTTDGDAWHEFSPDGRQLIVNIFGNTTLLIDVESGKEERFPETLIEPASWQRTAP